MLGGGLGLGATPLRLKSFAHFKVLTVALPVRSYATVYFELRPYGQLYFVEKQYCTVDHLARGSMKNAANCASECELQDI